MQTSMKPLFMRERAMRFLEVTMVHSMEGMLFALLSALFTVAGAAAFLEDSSWLTGGAGLVASAPAPASPVVARPVLRFGPAHRSRLELPVLSPLRRPAGRLQPAAPLVPATSSKTWEDDARDGGAAWILRFTAGPE